LLEAQVSVNETGRRRARREILVDPQRGSMRKALIVELDSRL
jgi:hypothetical protein